MSSSLRPSVGDFMTLGNLTQLFRFDVTVAGNNYPKCISSSFTNPDIWWRCQSHTTPNLEPQGTMDVNFRGNHIRQPGQYTWNSPLTVTITEFVDLNVTRFITEWLDAAWSFQRGQTTHGLTDYVKDITCDLTLAQLDPMDRVIMYHYLHGCWLESAAKPDFDGAGGAQEDIPLTIHYHFCERAIQAKKTTGPAVSAQGTKQSHFAKEF